MANRREQTPSLLQELSIGENKQEKTKQPMNFLQIVTYFLILKTVQKYKTDFYRGHSQIPSQHNQGQLQTLPLSLHLHEHRVDFVGCVTFS